MPILTTSCATDGVAAASKAANKAARIAAAQLRIPVMAFPQEPISCASMLRGDYTPVAITA
jgi:hypothetical protein